mmetsp:Transcript_62348/g.163673  ORF Transcript_62348/g.163673 Transcript_62348/m.163673 type:complete len:82 (-) Transcript_62348:307-552(-)
MIGEYSAQDLSITAWSFAKLHLRAVPLLAAISSQSIRRMRDFHAQSLANPAWSFAKLLEKDRPLLAAISAQALRRITELAP